MESKYHYIIGNGHGSVNPTQTATNAKNINGKIMTAGKRSPRFPKGNQFENQCLIEGVVNRDVVNYLSLMLTDRNISYDILVPNYIDMPLSVRCAKVNEINKKSTKPCLYISVHHNAFTPDWNSANGVSSHYFKKGGSYSSNGKRVAEYFQPELVKSSGMRNRGVIGSNFKVLRSTVPVALLLECGFMTNLIEATTLMTEQGKQNTAKGILAGILKNEQN